MLAGWVTGVICVEVLWTIAMLSVIHTLCTCGVYDEWIHVIQLSVFLHVVISSVAVGCAVFIAHEPGAMEWRPKI